MHNLYIAPESTIGSLKDKYRIFLAGSIDMGDAVDWQQDAIKEIKLYNLSTGVSIYNPRRKNWDSTWEQNIENPNFYQQVNWELDCLEKSTHIIMNLSKNSKAPISLLELGLFINTKKVFIVCEKGFYREGNVDIVCNRYRIPKYENLEEAIKEIFKN